MLTYAWDFDSDGDYDDAFGENPIFSASDKNGPSVVTVGLKITDQAGHSDTATADVSIENVAPTPDAGPNQTVYRNDVVYLEGSWMDPAGNLDDPYGWTWDLDADGIEDSWGSALYGEAIPASTSFALEGFYTLTFTVTDNDEGFGSDTITIEVLNQAPVCTEAMPSVELLWPANHKFVAIE
ncbi:MAG: PKD domain-containing protein, partial [Anaerolineales bacterium]|nr:PKD domain-containing protein [Anaerolineales bacterium]